MMQKFKKPISIVLSIMMVLSLFTIVPITASAETTGTVYDSGGHDASELNTGDYIVSGIESLTDENSEYTITLKAGTYTVWPDGESAYDEDYTIKMAGLFDIATDDEDGLCFTDWMEGNYIPFVDGKIANAFYVESADHDAKTITLAGANYSAEEPATAEPTTVEPTTAEPTTEPAPEPTTAEPSTEATTVAPGETLTYNLNDENANIQWDDNCSTEGHWSMYVETDDINFLLGSLNTPQAAGTYAWKDLDRTSCEIFVFEGTDLKWYYFTDGSCTVAVDGNTVTLNGTFTCQDGNTYVLNITTTQPEPTTVEPTTAEPTTVEPTTAEPTTVEPTTAEPTTVEPTTAEPPTDPAPADIYTVAGSSEAMFGTTWNASNTANDMTLGEGGVYSITYADVQPESAVQLKVVKNHSWDENWGDKETGNNYTFNVVSACDVTVTFDPATETVNVTGDGVTQDIELDVYSVIAVGNGEDGDPYLNGAKWDPCDPANAMTKVADGIWEFSMADIYAFDNYNIKFAVNSVDAEGKPTSNPWAHNFGSEVEQLYPTGEALDAVYNGKNCIFEVEENGSTVKFQLDLRDFDFATKTGAKMTITVTGPEPVEYTTAEPSTEGTTTPEEVGTVRVIARNDTYTTAAGAPWDGVLVDEEVAIDNDSNMKTAIVDALTKNSVDFTYSEWGYFQMVGGLNEYEADGSGGWMISLNDWFMNGGAEDFTVENNKLKDGDEIVIMYTLNWGADVGAHWGTLDTRLKSLEVSNGELDSEFDSDDLSYDLKITNGEGVKLTPVPINKNYQVRIYKNEYTPEAEGTELNKNAVIDVEDGDTLYIGIGNPSWPTMETESTETVYQIRINPAAEPTTAEPTTAEPTTVEPTTEPAPVDHTYTVAGSSAAMFGTTWDATNTANDMTKGDDGVFTIVYTDVQPENAIQLKVVEDHAWDHAWGDKETGDNYTFNVVSPCDVTVTFDPATETVNVTGDGVTQDTELDVYSVIAVGNGEETYLNGANWDPCDPANALTEVADGIWEMTMEDIYAFDNYNIKFAVNSVDAEGNPTSNPWAHNFGSEVEQLYPTGEELTAVYNGKNCIFEVEEDGSTVKFQLDLRDFDFKTKQGAKMTITVTAPTPPPAPVVVYADDLKPGDSVTSASKVFDTGDYTVILKGNTYASFTPEFTTVQEDDKSFPPKTFIYKPEDGIIFDVPLNQGTDPYEAILDPGTFDRYVPVDAQGERTNVLYVIDKTDDTITLGGYNKPVDDVAAMINALPDPEDVTVDTETALINARAAYDALTDAQKALIDTDTYKKLTDDEAAFAKIKADIDAVYDVVTLIEELPTAANVELSDKENIEAARAAYDALTDDQKAIFPADKLQKLTDDEAALAQIETDMAEAAIVDEMIKALPNPLNVSLNDKDDVAAASDAYNALTDAQKAYVPALSKIKLALVQAVVDAQEKYAADEAAADAVEEMIEALPDPADVTVADKEAINAAGAAYNALTSTQKRMVLLADRIKLERVQNALAKAINDAEAAQKVIDQINALPAPEDVTVEDRADIREARIAYTLLTDDQKALVDDETLQKLSDDEDVLADLLEVEAVTYMINSLPAPEDVTLNDKADIEAARTWYDTLSDAQKAMIDDETYKKLTDAEEALEALSGFTVTWMNGDEVLEVDANLPAGATPHYDGETPTKATDDKYVYEFMGWDPDLALVTADVTYNAVFDTYLIGDVNMDGSVDVFDAVEVQKYAADKAVLNDLQLRIADVNKDGNVDVLDASAIQRIAAS